MVKDRDDGQDATAGLPGTSVRRAGEFEGECVGPYRLVSLLGRGGMGEVYVATQETPVRRSVALKLLRARRLDARCLTHFEIERQLLAQMRHPAIAQIFDAGTTADGRPYSAMELIEGTTITAYCTRERLPLRARLRLFVRVCEGVQHAHQKGVVHRDLKPGNILVAKVDGRALPKIIDFGIASMMMSGGSSDGGDVVGTPAYMSPEQAATPDEVDTRSDIYSLGVLLHQLLCEHRPEASTRHAFRPSQRLAGLPREAQARVAADLGLAPATLRAMLVRDLDWVVEKATALDRARRYASATELAADLLRFLDGLPLLAVPPGRAYRWRKFARRQRAGIAAAGLVLTALLGGLGLSLYGLDQARTQQALAEERAQQLESVSRFQQAMLEDIDIESMGAQLSTAVREQLGRRTAADVAALEPLLAQLGPNDIARGMIDVSLLGRADAAIAREFGDQPAVAADLHASVARVREALGMHAAASAGHGRVAGIREQALGADAHAALDARLDQIRMLLLAGREHVDEVVALQDALRPRIVGLAPEHPARIRFEFDEARAQTMDDQQARRARLEAVLQRSREALGEDAATTLEIANNLAILLARLGESRLAGEMFEQLAPRYERLRGPAHQDLRAVRQNLAVVKAQSGDHDRAIALQRQIVAHDARTLGAEHPAALAGRGNLANMLNDSGRVEDALALSETLVADNERVMGAGHEQTVRSRLNRASYLSRLGRFDEALALQDAVVDARLRSLGPDHPDTLFIVANRASTLHRAGRSGEALAALDQQMPRLEQVLGTAHPTTQKAMEYRIHIARDIGRRDVQVDALRTLLAWREQSPGRDDWRTVETAWQLCEAMDDGHRSDESRALWDRYVAPLLAMPPDARSPAQARLADTIAAGRGAVSS